MEQKSDSLLQQEKFTEAEQYLLDYETPLEKWGYLDTEGNMAIKAKFDHAREFSEGLAAANIGAKWGYIDKSGKWVISPQFRAAYSFKDNIARIQTLDKKYGFIRPSGEYILPPVYDEIYDFSSGLARIKNGPVYNYLNSSGDTVIHKAYQSASDFRNEYAKVKNRKYGLINTKGEEIIALLYDQIYFPVEALVRFKQEGKYGFLDMKGKEFLPPKFDVATDFNLGMSMIRVDEQSLLLSIKGNKIHLGDKRGMGYAGNGRWKVKTKEGFWCLINETGTQVCECQYDLINNFSEGFALYQKDGAWGYLDVNGIELTPAVFPLAWDFKEGKARVILRGGVGYIDTVGEVIIPPYYFENRDFSEGLARVQVL